MGKLILVSLKMNVSDPQPVAAPLGHVERYRQVAEAAYYRAEKRGFAYGFALEDWLAAENLIDYEIRNNLPMNPP